jgi:hypothetical protein
MYLSELTSTQVKIKTLDDELRESQALNDKLSIHRNQEQAAAKQR